VSLLSDIGKAEFPSILKELETKTVSIRPKATTPAVPSSSTTTTTTLTTAPYSPTAAAGDESSSEASDSDASDVAARIASSSKKRKAMSLSDQPDPEREIEAPVRHVGGAAYMDWKWKVMEEVEDQGGTAVLVNRLREAAKKIT